MPNALPSIMLKVDKYVRWNAACASMEKGDVMAFLSRINEGMEVFDRTGDKIGQVDYVYFGEDNPVTPEAEAADVSERNPREENLVDIVAEAFRGNDMPDEMRERLQMHGFIRLNTGMLRSDRYVLPEQIASVTDNAVHLNATLDELLS